MDAAYLKAAHPEPFTVLGKKLEPFCLGHEIAFQRFGIKFSYEKGETPSMEDLPKAVFICSQPYTRGMSMDGFHISRAARFWTRVIPRYAELAFARFEQYIAAHTEIPEFFPLRNQPDGEPSGVPTVQAVKVSLMANMGMSEEEALNMPFSLAFWNHLSWLAQQGAIRLVDEAEQKAREDAAAESERIIELGRKLFPNGYGYAMEAQGNGA